MMKKSRALILVTVAFVAGILFSNVIPSGYAGENDAIDRTPSVLYSLDIYKTDRTVVLYVNDKYYHERGGCPFIIGRDSTKPLHVSRYEAVDRGFSPCPNCTYEEVDIH